MKVLNYAQIVTRLTMQSSSFVSAFITTYPLKRRLQNFSTAVCLPPDVGICMQAYMSNVKSWVFPPLHAIALSPSFFSRKLAQVLLKLYWNKMRFGWSLMNFVSKVGHYCFTIKFFEFNTNSLLGGPESHNHPLSFTEPVLTLPTKFVTSANDWF